MNFIENINYATNKAVDEGGKYAKLTAEYAKLKLFQQISYSFSFVAKIVVIGAFVFMALLFLLVAATVAVGNALGSFVLATLIMGVILLVIALVIYALRKQIDRRVIQLLSKNFFD